MLNNLEISASSAATCPTHGNFTSYCQVVTIGRMQREIHSTCPECKSIEATRAHLAQAERSAGAQQAKIEAMMMQSAIPKRFATSRFDTYQAETDEQRKVLAICQRYVANFEQHLERGTGMILAGKVGTGKSHLASAILQELMPKHVGAYTTMMDLVHLLREGWGGGAAKSEAKVLAEIGRLPLLVIDEIGVQFGSAAEQVHLFEVLDRRYRDMQPTLLLTNQDRAGFRGFVGDRIADRLSETANWVNFDWASYRTTARKAMA